MEKIRALIKEITDENQLEELKKVSVFIEGEDNQPVYPAPWPPSLPESPPNPSSPALVTEKPAPSDGKPVPSDGKPVPSSNEKPSKTGGKSLLSGGSGSPSRVSGRRAAEEGGGSAGKGGSDSKNNSGTQSWSWTDGRTAVVAILVVLLLGFLIWKFFLAGGKPSEDFFPKVSQG